MKVAKNMVVAVSYELNVEGQIADKATADKPLDYIHGTGMLLPRFEEELEGKEPGDEFSFTLSPEEGYGEYNPNFRVELPKDAFTVNGTVREDLLVVGRMIPMINDEGQVVQGIVIEVADDKVTMDFNHPMAGQVLNFSGKVESVREATEKELTEGLHGEYLPTQGCGGGCHGGCGGNCGDGGCCGECGDGGCGCN